MLSSTLKTTPELIDGNVTSHHQTVRQECDPPRNSKPTTFSGTCGGTGVHLDLIVVGDCHLRDSGGDVPAGLGQGQGPRQVHQLRQQLQADGVGAMLDANDSQDYFPPINR